MAGASQSPGLSRLTSAPARLAGQRDRPPLGRPGPGARKSTGPKGGRIESLRFFGVQPRQGQAGPTLGARGLNRFFRHSVLIRKGKVRSRSARNRFARSHGCQTDLSIPGALLWQDGRPGPIATRRANDLHRVSGTGPSSRTPLAKAVNLFRFLAQRQQTRAARVTFRAPLPIRPAISPSTDHFP